MSDNNNNDDLDTDDGYESSSDEQTSSDDIQIDFSLAEKNREREALQRQVEEFLARGGTINHIDPNVCADPPQKPSNNYGSRPI